MTKLNSKSDVPTASPFAFYSLDSSHSGLLVWSSVSNVLVNISVEIYYQSYLGHLSSTEALKRVLNI